MIRGHTHVIRTVTDKLADELDSWLEGPNAVSSDYSVQHVGGRDWVIVLRHASHDVEDVAESVPVFDPVRVEVYGSDHKYFQYEGGPAMPPDIAGLVEDARRTWVLWFGQDGRPKAMWLRRDTNGAVIDDPIAFSDTEPGGPGQVVQIPGWDIRMLRASR